MDQDRINKDLLLSRIIHSRDLTALEKRYLESLIEQDKPDSSLPQEFKNNIMQKFCETR